MKHESICSDGIRRNVVDVKQLVERLKKMRILTINPLPVEDRVNSELDELIKELQPEITQGEK